MGIYFVDWAQTEQGVQEVDSIETLKELKGCKTMQELENNHSVSMFDQKYEAEMFFISNAIDFVLHMEHDISDGRKTPEQKMSLKLYIVGLLNTVETKVLVS